MEIFSDRSKGIVKTDERDHFTEMEKLPFIIKDWIQTHSKEMAAVWDEHGMLQFITKSAENLLGININELKGQRWENLFGHSDIFYIQKGIHELEAGKSFSIKIKFKHENTQEKWFYCTTAKQIIEGRTYFVSLLDHLENESDIDDLFIRSEKLSVAGQLAASIVHEIRNPLTSLRGFVQLMQAGVEPKDEYYSIMVEEIDKMEAMTTELLYISKPPVDKKCPESVNQMIEDVIVLLEPQAKKDNIELVWEKGPNTYIFCNRSQIKQVFINLIKNAIEAINKNGKVNVQSRVLANYVLIDVSDDGPGIPEELIDRLDEPFFTTKENGTGLGLMVTKKLLDKHDARLKVVSKEGEGTTFHITIPLCSDCELETLQTEV